jgi:glycerol-3-phosphate cytidylyltransferase-like family protein
MHGYTTGTLDLLHDGHFQILRLMRQQCARLTVQE